MQGILTPDGAVRIERIYHFNAYYNALDERWCGRGKHWADPLDFHEKCQWCRECRESYRKERYDPEAKRRANFRYNYGMDSRVYDQLFQFQGGVCAICGRPPEYRKIGRARTPNKSLTLDHCHRTKLLRGLLCYECNLAIGWMRDNVENIDKMRAYIENNGVEGFYEPDILEEDASNCH